MSSKKINVAIVGLGFGAEFIPIYLKHPNATMYAICQRTQSKLDEIGNAFGIEHRYASERGPFIDLGGCSISTRSTTYCSLDCSEITKNPAHTIERDGSKGTAEMAGSNHRYRIDIHTSWQTDE